ncbi:unnamed protein product [Blepharisma stoltei]|uniref:Phosphonopyruvate decarboxylase n=1 Tax=Blepharisma stoltei TaxID=1481888 RepID=A0AAU9II36_9CILI|nr:unnamed protein product [Blepharisma stoltei]
MLLSRTLRNLNPLQRWIRTHDAGPLEELERDFLPSEVLYKQFSERGFDFYAGVPDSFLKDFTGYIADNHPPNKHIITANEGTAVSVAAGYYMATRKYPIVYLQNSGLGNVINPILSLCDTRVYKIPILFLIGWRGEPGKKDEPQHLVQGKVMSNLLTDLSINYDVLPNFEEGSGASIDTALYHLKSRGSPYAFLVRRKNFVDYDSKSQIKVDLPMSREDAIDKLTDKLSKFDIVVSTSGFASRELSDIRHHKNQHQDQDFYCVGSSGHTSSIALGIAIAKPSKKVYCFDGDGSFLMHMGSIATNGSRQLPNFRHILLNNGCHDTVGGQPTNGFDIDFPRIAKACGYKYVASVSTKEELDKSFNEMEQTVGSCFLEIKVARRTRNDLGRFKGDPKDNKVNFMNFLEL